MSARLRQKGPINEFVRILGLYGRGTRNDHFNADRGRAHDEVMEMITKPQRRFLLDLEKRGRDFMSVDKRVYSSLAKLGLAEGRFSALNDGYVCITPAGKEALAEDIERQAGALWRADHPEASVFSCDHRTKEKYRKKIRADRTPRD